MFQSKNAFTLVELIVVVTIIAILGTVWFISYTNYLTGARDSSRISQVTRISDALQVHTTRSQLPLPEDFVRLENTGILFAYQGALWENVLQTINYSSTARDPKDNTPFTYLVTSSRNNFQILIHLEDASKLQTYHMQAYANLQSRHVKVLGSRLWALVAAETLQPLERTGISVYESTDNTNTTIYRAYVSDNEYVEGTPTEIQELSQVMRDRGRGWRVENNSFTCFDPEWVFPCSILAWGWGSGWGGSGWSGWGGPTPWPAWYTGPEEFCELNNTTFTINSSTTPSSDNCNHIVLSESYWSQNVNLDLWNNNYTILTRWWNDTISAWYGNNHITILWWSNTVNLWDGYNYLSIEHGWPHSVTVWHGDNTIIGDSGVMNIITGNGNNDISFTSNTNGRVIQLWNGNNTISVWWVVSITTGISWSTQINFTTNHARTTTWRGWNLTVNGFFPWWDIINVSHISSLNNCTDINSSLIYSNWNQTATITTPQGTLTLNWAWSATLNCNDRFQF
jgi:prepilin-type N-terminal cleavage/methylation domain-containing protein